MNGNRLYDFALLQRADAKSIEEGISPQELMGNAAHASHLSLRNSWLKKPSSTPGRILFLCGSGNNGGDGYALAWHIACDPVFSEIPLQIFRSSEPKTETARLYAERIRDLKIPVASLESFFLEKELANGDLLVDALLGSGQKSPLRGTMLEVLLKIKTEKQRKSLFLLSLDLPTGLSESRPERFYEKKCQKNHATKKEIESHTNSSHSNEPSLPMPDAIHSYGLPKLATALHPDLALSRHTKRLQVKEFPIGFPPDAIPESPFCLSQAPSKLQSLLRPDLGHKYQAGHAFLIGGSSGMEGALLLAARAFFAAGGGILHCFVPEKSQANILNAMPELMVQSLSALPAAFKKLPLPGSIALGMGLSQVDLEKHKDLLLTFFLELYLAHSAQSPKLLIDASATKLILKLNQAVLQEKLHKAAHKNENTSLFFENILLTPHTGEWKKLGGLPITDVASLKQASEFQKRIGAACLIKDSISVLLESERNTIFPTPNGNLSVAGSGDILAGILAAVLSRSSLSPSFSRSFWQNSVSLAVALQHKAASFCPNPRASELILGIQQALKKY